MREQLRDLRTTSYRTHQNIWRLIAAALALLLAIPAAVQAQQEITLRGNPILQRYHAAQAEQLPKGWDTAETSGRNQRECRLEQPGIVYIEAGQTAYFRINLDTVGLGPEAGMPACVNCDGNPIGSAVIEGDSLVVTADAEILGQAFTFTVERCSPNDCKQRSFAVVGRRLGQRHFPPTTTLQAEQRGLATAQASLLPGPLGCNKFIHVPGAYEGRDQRIYFTDYTGVDSSIYYEASRYAGVDSVYVVLCDSFAICDTFHFAFRIQKDTLRIGPGGRQAFLDDFSYPGPVTDPELWLDSDTYVNATYPLDAPSVGVATFDGVDRRGRPYGGSFGPADRLTSTYLNLTGNNDPLFLSFWLQQRGLGEFPEPQDIIKLEFKRSNGNWQEIQRFPGVAIGPGAEVDIRFKFYSFPIPNEYKYQAFQFRFTSYNDRQGIDDIWNLDYVHLSRFAGDTTINDVAFTALPRAILERYSSMPWRHFRDNEAQELSNAIAVGVRNLSPQPQNADPSRVRITEEQTGTPVLDATLFNGLERNIPQGIPQNRVYTLEGDPNFPYSSYLSAMSGSGFDDLERVEFTTEYTLVNGSQTTGLGFEPVLRNDRVEHTTVFDNYFAYDDGSAETGVVVQTDDQIAIKFTANVPDTLRAVRFHFPHMIGNVANQEFHLKVWIGQLDNQPDFRMNFLRPFYASSAFDTLQGFTTYPLLDAQGNFKPLALPAGDFYIGWEQASNCTFTNCIPVGYDKNTPESLDYLYFNKNSTVWVPFPANFPAGALMVRPVVGSETPGFTSTDEAAPAASALRLFPNPAREVVFLQLETGFYEDFQLYLFNSMGQLVHQGPLRPQLEVAGLAPGVYVLKAVSRRHGEALQARLVVAR
jgi:hypothetical protein